MERDQNRDVSEQIALGIPVKRVLHSSVNSVSNRGNVSGTGGGDACIDQRLFNQSQGMDSGFGVKTHPMHTTGVYSSLVLGSTSIVHHKLPMKIINQLRMQLIR